MKQKLFYFLTTMLIMLAYIFTACSGQDDELDFPLSAEIFYSVDAKQVAFSALTHSAVSWEWDFGDGNSSSEKNPVHVYENGGYYAARLTAKDSGGNTVTKEVNLAIDLTPFALLTGDQTAEGYDGKTWKLTASHSVNDILANSDAELSLMDDGIPSLPTGTFDMYLGLPEAYNHEFTFYNNGDYRQNSADGSAFGGIVYAMVLQQLGLSDITKTGGKAVFGVV